MDIEEAIEEATEALDTNPAMDPASASIEESLEFAQGIAFWAETTISALRSDLS